VYCCLIRSELGQDRQFFTRLPLDFERPEPRRALTMLVEFVHNDGISPAAVSDFDELTSYTQMLDEDGVFVRGWPNFLESYRVRYKHPEKFELVERAPLPHFEGKPPVSVFGGWNLMISKNSPRKKEALELARFFQREEMQKVMFELGGYSPTNAEAAKRLGLAPPNYHRMCKELGIK
jgi:multiple sugar transport system substrate-binding protein